VRIIIARYRLIAIKIGRCIRGLVLM